MASLVGLLLTLIIFLSLFGLTVYMVVKMIFRHNPNVTVSEEETNASYGDHVTIGLGTSSFYFGFGLFTNDVVSDPEILDINVTSYNYTYIIPSNITMNKYNMNAVLCDWYDQNGQWDNQGHCIDRDVTLLSGLQGPDHTEFQSLKVYLSPCSEQRGSEICKHPERINEILHKSEFRVTYTHPHVNHHDFDLPITLDYINYEEWILPGFTKTLTFFVTKIKIITDNGWLFESKEEKEAIIVQSQRTTIRPRYNEHDPFFKFVITATDKVIIYHRSYTKIQDVFADITGLASFIVLILALFARPFFQFKMNEALVNSMYDVLINENAYSSVIGIVDHNSGNDNDKKGGEDGHKNFQNSNSLKTFIHTRSKSSRIGVEDNKRRTMSVYETQTTFKSEANNPRKQEQRPLEVENLKLPSNNLPQASGSEDNLNPKEKENEIVEAQLQKDENNLESLDHISKTTSFYYPQRSLKGEAQTPKPQEPPELEGRDLEMYRKQSSESNHNPVNKEKNELDNEIVEIELDADGHNLESNPVPVSAPSQTLPPLPQLEPRFKIDVSFKEWVLSFFRPQLQVKILQEAEELLSRNLDIVTVVKKMSDINKLKECLLTEQQRILFDNLPHSFVLLDPVTRKKSAQVERGDGRNGSYEDTAEDKVKETYIELRDSPNKTELDSKILSLYEKKCLKFSGSGKDNT